MAQVEAMPPVLLQVPVLELLLHQRAALPWTNYLSAWLLQSTMILSRCCKLPPMRWRESLPTTLLQQSNAFLKQLRLLLPDILEQLHLSE